MTIALVTGASGFIGRHAVRALVERGYSVHAATRRSTHEGPAQWHQLDLLDAGARRALLAEVNPSHLLHLAWVTEPGRFWEARENLDWLAASLELVRAFADQGGRRTVVAGSCAEYDWNALGETDGRCHETMTPRSPRTLYGAAKAALQQTLEVFARAAGLSQAWGRLFFLYGPHEPEARLVPDVVAALLDGRPAPCTHGRQVRDFLDARDAGAAFAALLDSDVEGPVNIASGEGVSVADLVGRLGRLVGRPELIRLGALPAPEGEPERLVADTLRLTGEVGFTPRIPLDQGLADAVAWWRAERSS